MNKEIKLTFIRPPTPRFPTSRYVLQSECHPRLSEGPDKVLFSSRRLKLCSPTGPMNLLNHSSDILFFVAVTASVLLKLHQKSTVFGSFRNTTVTSAVAG